MNMAALDYECGCFKARLRVPSCLKNKFDWGKKKKEKKLYPLLPGLAAVTSYKLADLCISGILH